MLPELPVVQPVQWDEVWALITGFYTQLTGSSTSVIDVAAFQSINDPLLLSLVIATTLGLICWILSLPTKNYSWVDKLWSIVPPMYVWIFLLNALGKMSSTGGPMYTRLIIMTILTTIWGARLTYNFYRKGGYALSAEDYRWKYVERGMHPVAFQLLNATFVGFMQHWLLMWLAVPAYIVLRVGDQQPLNYLDAVAPALFLFFFTIEIVADQQQWNFQTKKYALINSNSPRTGDYKRGFLTTGLFRFSRHPNFFAEQCIWWCVYLFAVAATGTWIQPWVMIGGPLSLMAIFAGSTPLTEEITLGKYPRYADYQKTTSRLIPWFPGKPLRDD